MLLYIVNERTSFTNSPPRSLMTRRGGPWLRTHRTSRLSRMQHLQHIYPVDTYTHHCRKSNSEWRPNYCKFPRMKGYTLNIVCVSVACVNGMLKVETVKRIYIILVCRENNKRYFYVSRTRKCEGYYQIFALQLTTLFKLAASSLWTVYIF